MKKTLLLMAALAAPMFAMAQDVDITPEGYDFSKSQIMPTTIPVESPWNDWNVAAPACFDNAGGRAAYNVHKGLLVAVGPNWRNAESEHFQNLMTHISYVDLGGEVGRVMCLYGGKQDEDYDFNYYYNAHLNVGQGSPAGGNLNFFMDPDNTPKLSKGQSEADATEHIHVRIVCNVYDADAGNDSAFGNIYCVNNDGSQNGKGPNGELPSHNAASAITCDEFFDPDTYEWNPDQWLVYEFDTYCPADDEKGTVFSPLRLKMEISEASLGHCVIFIKEIKFFKSTDSDITIGGVGRKRSFITLKPGDLSNARSENPDAINAIQAIANKSKAHDLAGRRVKANQKGLYIADGKKVLVK